MPDARDLMTCAVPPPSAAEHEDWPGVLARAAEGRRGFPVTMAVALATSLAAALLLAFGSPLSTQSSGAAVVAIDPSTGRHIDLGAASRTSKPVILVPAGTRTLYAWMNGPRSEIGDGVSAATWHGAPISKLLAGNYALVVAITPDPRLAFGLTGPGIHRKTRPFSPGHGGYQTWVLTLRSGTYRYTVTGLPPKTFQVYK